MTLVANIILGVCTAWTLAGLTATYRVSRKRVPVPQKLPAVSVLKPLCGADAGLEKNLETFFLQDHPDFELVFGVEDTADPALLVVDTLRKRYPQVHVQVVVHGPSVVSLAQAGINPKVRNLRGMLPHAVHDLVLVSDSNVAAPPDYLGDLVATHESDPRIGLVTNLFAGVAEDTLGAALENVQLNGFCAGGTALPTLLGDSSVVGKSMLFRRSLVQELGGLERVKDVLAEDYVLGKTFQHAGYRVAIASTVLHNVTSKMSLKAFHERHLRWGMLRWRLRPVAYAAELFASPLVLLPLAMATLGPAVGLAWCVSVALLRDVGGWYLLRGAERLWLPLVLSPLREVCILFTWGRALFKRHLQWRNNRVRLGAGTLLFEPKSTKAH
ncbi:MAG: glycosyltransferase [Polyangiaceae bacterium]|nr:glycosyltransferase [Polyangiaceae bacterium]